MSRSPPFRIHIGSTYRSVTGPRCSFHISIFNGDYSYIMFLSLNPILEVSTRRPLSVPSLTASLTHHSIIDQAAMPAAQIQVSLFSPKLHLSLLPQPPILSNLLQPMFQPLCCFINHLVRTSITLSYYFTTNGSSLPSSRFPPTKPLSRPVPPPCPGSVSFLMISILPG